jgi:hypothetical protein
MQADVYVMSKPNMHFDGVVDSIGFGVTPDPDVIGRLENGLPDVQRTLNWVHLASHIRFVYARKIPPPLICFELASRPWSRFGENENGHSCSNWIPTVGTQPDLRFYSPPPQRGFLHYPDRTWVLRHQGIDGQQRDTFNSRLGH